MGHGLSCPTVCAIFLDTRDQICFPCTGRQILNRWTSREALPLVRTLVRLGQGPPWGPHWTSCSISQLCLTLCDPMDSSVHGILQAKILKWVAMPSSRGSSWPSDPTHVSYVSCIGRRALYHEHCLGSLTFVCKCIWEKCKRKAFTFYSIYFCIALIFNTESIFLFHSHLLPSRGFKLCLLLHFEHLQMA